MSYELYLLATDKIIEDHPAAFNEFAADFESEELIEKQNSKINDFKRDIFQRYPEESKYWDEMVYEQKPETAIFYLSGLDFVSKDEYALLIKDFLTIAQRNNLYVLDPQSGKVVIVPDSLRQEVIEQLPKARLNKTQERGDFVKGLALIALGILIFFLTIYLRSFI